MAEKMVYSFGSIKTDGTAEMKELLGGKGANLAEMANLGMPVPPGFTITTEVCTHFSANEGAFPKGIQQQVEKGLVLLEKEMGKKFGDQENPLLLSVRSGARASMPGMMDTILNLGLNDTTVAGMAAKAENPRFAWDCYRRFIQMYGDVVLGVRPKTESDRDPFEVILTALKKKRKANLDVDLTAEDLMELVAKYKAMMKKDFKIAFPEDPWEQLWGAISAVFQSWNNERAFIYRRLNDIPDEWGTAVNIQSMVFGNMGETSGTGVAFTRDPASGENVFYGEFLMNAQGEDVVAGIRTPQPISELEKVMPKPYKQLLAIRKKLEKHYHDMQDVEFTIEDGKLFMLQTRAGKRTGFAAVRMAVDMVEERLIKKEEALLRIDPNALNQFLQPVFDFADKKKAAGSNLRIAKGLAAGPGAAAGKIFFTSEALEAAKHANPKENYILVREETSPEDIKGMEAAVGILTARGGMTSHAALVARQMGKVCVVGCSELEIDYKKKIMTVEGRKETLKEGDSISVDGFTGEVFASAIKTNPSEVIQVLVNKKKKADKAPVYQTFAKVMGWADAARTLNVRTNADQPDQSANAVALGAEGIGLCRTEHMFFGEGRILKFRAMIMAENEKDRRDALKKLLPMQRRDFEGIFKAMAGRPVTIRTLDPPLHEFLPHTKDEMKELAAELGVSLKKVQQRADDLKESNPMLGHRGCRLGMTYPEIVEMQARAIIEAAINVNKKFKLNIVPEIMIPLVSHINELKRQAAIVRETAEKVFKAKKTTVEYMVGTMIELPRAALTADEIAQEAEFFSFGTNDLTQTTFGLSRDDAGTFLREYLADGILDSEPFASVDVNGVGQLMKIGVEKGRSTRNDLKVGICGEHGGDPKSVEFCHNLGLNYVSCSPFRVPIARLAAAQAALKDMPAPKKKAPAKKKAAKKPAKKAVKKTTKTKK